MSDHQLVTDQWHPIVKSRCTCGQWTAETPDAEHRAGMHTREHKIHAEAVRLGAERLARDTARDWYQRTGHCHGCGQPGNWCQCGTYNACGCRDLHPMGSGIRVDPLDVFADQPISLDQGELFA